MRRLTAILIPFLALAARPLLAQPLNVELRQYEDFGATRLCAPGPSCTVNGTAAGMTVSAPPKAKIVRLEGTLPQYAYFAVPLDVSASAYVNLETPFSDDPNKDFTATLTVFAKDFFGKVTRCSGLPHKVSAKRSQKISLSAGLGPCTIPDLERFNGHCVGAAVEVQFHADLAVSWSPNLSRQQITASYDDFYPKDGVAYSATAPVDSTGRVLTTLSAGSTVTLKGSFSPFLATMPEGRVQVFVIDRDGRVLAKTEPTTVKRKFCTSVPVSFPITLPAEDTELGLLTVLQDARGADLALAFQPYSVRGTVLGGKISRSAGGQDYWLPGVPVELWERDARGTETLIASTLSKLKGSVKTPSSEYAFTAKDFTPGFSLAGKTLRLKAKLQDGDHVRYLNTSNGSNPVWKPFNYPGTVDDRDLNVLASKLDRSQVTDSESSELGAESYWHLWRQAYVMAPLYMPPGVDPPLGLRTVDSGDVGIFGRSATEILVPRWSKGKSPHELWSLWGQGLLDKLWGGVAKSVPAAGDEVLGLEVNRTHFGLAWAALSAQVIDRKRNGEVVLLYQATGSERSMILEENQTLAAQIMWDLIDSHLDSEPRNVKGRDVVVDDAVDTLGMQDITTAIGVEPHPANLDALLSRLVDLHPALSAPYRDGLSYAEHLVELHRTPPKVRRPSPLAESEPDPFAPIPGSFIAVTLVAPDGSPLESSRLDIEYVFGPGYESQNRKESRLVNAGNVYFEMPPDFYPVQAFLSIPGSSEAPLMIDNAAYWAAVPTTADHFLAHTFEVPQDVPQLDAVYPSYAAAGTIVRLFGRNFGAGAAVVTFGGVPARIYEAYQTLIVLQVPALAGGTVPVKVTRSGTSSNTADFDVLAPAFSVQPASLDFGTVPQGPAVEKLVTVRNSGEAPLSISGMTTTGSFSVRPTVTPFQAITVEPGAQRSFTVAFAPRSTAAASGTLVISTNDVVHRSVTIALSGSGGAVTGPDITAGTGALDFGSVVTAQSRDAALTVRNRGSATLNVTAATFGSTVFKLVSPALPVAIPAGAEQALTLRFSPAAVVRYTDSVALTSDDPDEPKRVIPLSGTGVATGTTPSTCTYAVTPGALTVGFAAASGSLAVTAGAGCAWTAASADSFVTLGSASGTGNGAVGYTVARNDGGLRNARLTVAGITLYLTQEGDPAPPTATVPIVLSSAGVNNSFFTSELTLTNRGLAGAVAEFTYTAAFGGGSGTASDILPGSSQLIFPDALEYLRSIGIPIPATGNRGGTLRVSFGGLSTPAAASATVRTASVVPEGRAGLAYASVARSAALTGTSYLCGLRQNATDRANVAVINAGKASDGDVVLRLTIFSGDPSNPMSRALPDVGLPPGGFAQFSGILGLNGLSLSNGWVKVERIGGTAPYYAYAIINDQANSDGSFVPPVTAEGLAGKTGLTLPVAVEVSTFSTELVVTNFGTSQKSFQVTFVADGVTAAGNAATITFDLKAGEQRILPDFVQYLRDQHVAGVGPKGPTFAGAAFLSVTSGDVSGLFIGARTSSPGGGGRYGLFYTGVANGAAASGVAYLYGLQQNGDNRANVALVNTGETDGSTSVFRIDIFDGATGFSAGSVPSVTLGPKRWTQLSGILTQYAPGVSNAYVRVTRTAGNNPFVAYAVINDGGAPGQRSGDGAFVTMESE